MPVNHGPSRSPERSPQVCKWSHVSAILRDRSRNSIGFLTLRRGATAKARQRGPSAINEIFNSPVITVTIRAN